MSPGLSGCRSGLPAVDFLFLARSFVILCLSWDMGPGAGGLVGVGPKNLFTV